jgi:hypothetical protein
MPARTWYTKVSDWVGKDSEIPAPNWLAAQSAKAGCFAYFVDQRRFFT